jgi:hypothetical protein
MTIRRICAPALAIALSLICGVIFLFLLQVWLQKDIFLVKSVFWGFDYNDFHQASRQVLEGKSPYNVKRYVTPPLAASLNLPLGMLRFEQARLVMGVLVIAALVRSYTLMMTTAGLDEKTSLLERRLIMLCGLIIIFLSYPFYFLLERLNLDSIVLFLLCLGIFYCYLEEKEPAIPLAFAAGTFIAMGICIKVYPALIILPLVIGRRWRILMGLGTALLLLIATSWPQWMEYFSGRLARRADMLAPEENGSLYSTLDFLGKGVQMLMGQGDAHSPLRESFINATPYLYAALLLTKAIADHYRVSHHKPSWASGIAVWYIPFMIALPRTAYHYEFVALLLLIPALCAAWEETDASSASRKNRAQRLVLGTMIFGIMLSQQYAVSLEHMFATINVHVIPGAGLMLVLITSTSYSVLQALTIRSNAATVNRVAVGDAL